MPEQWKRDRIENDRKALIKMSEQERFHRAMGKVTEDAAKRMRKTAKQQLAEAHAAGFAPPDLPEPDDADDSSIRGVMR